MGRGICKHNFWFFWALSVLLAQALVPPTARAENIFVDASAQSKLDFEHFNGMTGELFFVEMMGAGGGLLDYDNDGDLDVYLVQGAELGPGESQTHNTDQLYRNDLSVHPDGRHELSFTNVTQTSAISAGEYGMAVAMGDYNNDGWTDVYVVNFGNNQLWRNNGDGTFEDVTQASGTGDERWGTGAVFFDFDRDGWLDLFVINYVDYTVETHHSCHTDAGLPDYCGPRTRHPESDKLFRNRGDGTFEDVTAPSGVGRAKGRGLGVVAGDFNGDGWDDLYVANDQDPNHLWVNLGDGTFINDALLAGCAVNDAGVPEAGMGVTAGDFDNDGDDDLFMTHLVGETNTLYENISNGWFVDRTSRSGLGAPSWTYTGFGTSWLDFDNDGLLDLMIMNGEVRLIRDQVREGEPHPLRQQNQLFRGIGQGRFEEVSNRDGQAMKLREVSRAGIFGDIDNDGDTDVLVTNNGGAIRLLINQVGNERDWVGIQLLTGKRDALGARVVVRAGAKEISRVVRTSGSYLASSDPRIIVGLNEHRSNIVVRVLWTDGKAEQWTGVMPRRYTVLRRGSGASVAGS